MDCHACRHVRRVSPIRWPIRDMRYNLAFQTFSVNFTWNQVSLLRFHPAHRPDFTSFIVNQLENMKSRWTADLNRVKNYEIKITLQWIKWKNMNQVKNYFHRGGNYLHRGGNISTAVQIISNAVEIVFHLIHMFSLDSLQRNLDFIVFHSIHVGSSSWFHIFHLHFIFFILISYFSSWFHIFHLDFIFFILISYFSVDSSVGSCTSQLSLLFLLCLHCLSRCEPVGSLHEWERNKKIRHLARQRLSPLDDNERTRRKQTVLFRANHIFLKELLLQFAWCEYNIERYLKLVSRWRT